MRLVDPDDPCLCGSGLRWAECCAQRLPLTLRFIPVRLLAPDDYALAGCGRGGHCCRGVHVPLTPFDVFRIARGSATSTTAVLENVAVITPEGAVEIDGDPACPFLEGDRCAIYAHRPDACRRYPFWRVDVNGVEWLVERHTCAGCWSECRSQRVLVSRFIKDAGLRAGQEMESLYEDALQRLEDAGVPEEAIEAFMSLAYDLDSVDADTGSGDSAADFRQAIERLVKDYSRHSASALSSSYHGLSASD